jgi:hypothetical protein
MENIGASLALRYFNFNPVLKFDGKTSPFYREIQESVGRAKRASAMARGTRPTAITVAQT